MINPKELPLVSLNTMNEVHFEEVVIINSLLEQLENKVSFEVFSESLEKLLEHMQEHFSSEEKLMKDFQYPSLQMHKSDHDKVLNQTRYAEMEWRNKRDEDEIREYLQGDIIPWLEQHIKAMDVPMADFISHLRELQK